MNIDRPDPNDAKLSGLLRESRAAPPLRPRFQENVWRRIDSANAAGSVGLPAWLDALAVWVLRPQLAFAGVAVLILAGGVLGLRDGADVARRDAQTHYLAAVAPNSLH